MVEKFVLTLFINDKIRLCKEKDYYGPRKILYAKIYKKIKEVKG